MMTTVALHKRAFTRAAGVSPGCQGNALAMVAGFCADKTLDERAFVKGEAVSVSGVRI
jgi:hypothetical protein